MKKLQLSVKNPLLLLKIEQLINHLVFGTSDFIELPSIPFTDFDNCGDIAALFDIASFCSAEKFICRREFKEKDFPLNSVVFLKPTTFFKNVKYIIVSATVHEVICRKYFKKDIGEDNVDFYECKKAKYKGTLFQYFRKPMGRSCIDNFVFDNKDNADWKLTLEKLKIFSLIYEIPLH